MKDNLDDLQSYHHLKNEIVDLKRRLVNAYHRVDYANKALEAERIKGSRGNKARLLIELKLGGHLDWSLEKIAEECFLCDDTVKTYVGQFKNTQGE